LLRKAKKQKFAQKKQKSKKAKKQKSKKAKKQKSKKANAPTLVEQQKQAKGTCLLVQQEKKLAYMLE
jgi:hypothetical protein